MIKTQEIWVIDLGSQYTQLIIKTLRKINVFSKLMTLEMAKTAWDDEKINRPSGIILSGGPSSVYEDKHDYSFLFNNTPLMGICYGMQLLAHHLGGKVDKGVIAEYGEAIIDWEKEAKLLDYLYRHAPSIQVSSPMKDTHLKTLMNHKVWMSHFDHVSVVPKDFSVLAKSKDGLIAAMIHESRPYLGVQFHPEVEHTDYGKEIFSFFAKEMCQLKLDWTSDLIVSHCAQLLKDSKPDHILCAFSGGVDSLVAAKLCSQIFPGKVYCFFVDHGLLRTQDSEHIEVIKKENLFHLEIVSAQDLFLNRLSGISDPEEKRKIIGKTFIDVFEMSVSQFEKSHGIIFSHLLQGTLYPDVIESLSPLQKEGGRSVTIKSHHNVGGLPDRMKLKLLEPFRELFKDEVRVIGAALGLPKSWIKRHPFPGPGLSVRVLGEVTLEKIKKVRESDQILFEELKKANLYDVPWQAFTVLLPVKTVGVKGDERVFEEVICLRLVQSVDGMTATWCEMPFDFFRQVSRRITNEVRGITRVVYDITNKPPGTIEWE